MIKIVEIAEREGTTGMKEEADIGAGVANQKLLISQNA